MVVCPERGRPSPTKHVPAFDNTPYPTPLPSLRLLSIPPASAMARILSQTLIRDPSSPSHLLFVARCPLLPLFTRLVNHRGRSDRPDPPGPAAEADLDADPAAPSPLSPDPESELSLRIFRLEDALHKIVIRRSAPDWLPFIPGSSYWVPPRKRLRISNPLSEEDAFSLTIYRRWSSSSDFVEGNPLHEVKESSGKATPQSEDEES